MNKLALQALALGVAGLSASANAQEPTTVIVGHILAATNAAPLPGVTLSVGTRSVVSDSAGRVVLVVPRSADAFELAHDAYLGFRYPILKLDTDTLKVTIQMRPDPVPASLLTFAGKYLPLMCAFEEPGELGVYHTCASPLMPSSMYARRSYKHNQPLRGPYFGRAVDGGGIMVLTRLTGTR